MLISKTDLTKAATSEALFLSKNKAYRTKKGFNKLLEGNPSMDFVLRIIEGTPSLHTPDNLTKLLAHYRVMYHLKKLMAFPFAQTQETINEILYVYPALSAWGILLILWEFPFTRTPEVFGAFIAAKPDEYETQLCQELCPEFRAYLTA